MEDWWEKEKELVLKMLHSKRRYKYVFIDDL